MRIRRAEPTAAKAECHRRLLPWRCSDDLARFFKREGIELFRVSLFLPLREVNADWKSFQIIFFDVCIDRIENRAFSVMHASVTPHHAFATL